MQRLFSVLKQVFFSNILAIGLVSLFSFAGAWAIAPATGYAATMSSQSTQEKVISPDSQPYSSREEAYEKATEAAKDPNGLEKEYKKDLKIYQKDHPEEGGLIEGAKEAIEKVTGND